METITHTTTMHSIIVTNDSKPLALNRITTISENAFAIIKHFEGLHLRAYKCPAGLWTIGYGTTRYPGGSKVRKGDRITRETAETLLRLRLRYDCQAVDDMTRDDVTQQEFDALVCLHYNIDSQRMRTSTLLRHVNAHSKDRERITDSFCMWRKAHVNGVLVELEGLMRRRRSEAHLFNTGEVRFFED